MGVERSEALWTRARWLLKIPTDVVVVFGYVAVMLALVNVVDAPGPVTRLVGVPFVLFLPGYALLSVLYPSEETGETRQDTVEGTVQGSSLTWPVRVAVSFGTSLALLPVVGLALSASGAGFEARTVTATLAGVILAGMVLGAVRRVRRVPADRYTVPYRRWIDAVVDATVEAPSRRDAAFNVVLSLLVVFAALGLGYGLVTSGTGASQSELYLLTETDDGDMAAAGFSEPFQQGERRPVIVGLENNEGRTVTYTVAVEVQRVSTEADDVTVQERDAIDRFSVTLEDGESTRARRAVGTSMTGEDLRVVFFVYIGEAPDDPSTDTAYRSAYVWIDVDDA